MAVTTIDGVNKIQIRNAKNGDFDLNLATGGGSGGDSQGLYYEFITTYDAQDEATQTIVPGRVKPNQQPFNFGATSKRIYDGPSKVLVTYNYETDPAGNSTDLKKILIASGDRTFIRNNYELSTEILFTDGEITGTKRLFTSVFHIIANGSVTIPANKMIILSNNNYRIKHTYRESFSGSLLSETFNEIAYDIDALVQANSSIYVNVYGGIVCLYNVSNSDITFTDGKTIADIH